MASYTQEERVFIQKALLNGFKQQDIQKEIESKRKRESTLGKIATITAGIVPGLFGTAGAIGGLMLGSAPGAFLGGAAGYGSGKALEDVILKGAGLRTDTPEESGKRVMDVTKGAVVAGGTNLATYGIGKLLSKAFGLLKNPLQKVGQMKGNIASNVNIPEASINEVLAEAPTKRFATGQMQSAARNVAGKWAPELVPMEGTTTTGISVPQNINAKAFYDRLLELEKLSKAFKNGVPTSQSMAAEGLASELRMIPNQISPQLARMNTIYSSLAKMAPYFNQAKMSTARSLPWILGGGYLSGKLKEAFGNIGGD